jgi:hypothetical protein
MSFASFPRNKAGSSPPPSPPAEQMGQAPKQRRGRQLVIDGLVWTVYEHVVNYGDRLATTLVFDRPGLVRRIRRFPTNWMELDDRALHALSDGT